MHNSSSKNTEYNTNFVRIRKPPGGDTSDIFNLGTLISTRNQNKENLTDSEKTVVIEKMKASERNSCRINSPKVSELDQENIIVVTHPDDDLAEHNLHDVESNENKPDESVNEEFAEISLEDEETKSQNFVHHNPITGEVRKLKGVRPKLQDCSNKMKRSVSTIGLGLARPSIRVRQPPGGVSSNIFQF
ncbi:uncharacterized protein [Parasteatoda tepidariorum]|uniref:uncharacterized protein n=1 Tax=Parasteatoda tepidariorum TaxID=114398 RepID=UPI00077FB415|nr:uncharacterized protein LOC107438422 [Parasteatoda tepidariorum]